MKTLTTWDWKIPYKCSKKEKMFPKNETSQQNTTSSLSFFTVLVGNSSYYVVRFPSKGLDGMEK